MSDAVVVSSPGIRPGRARYPEVEEALKNVVDPELGANVIDLGLVYGLEVDQENILLIRMTLTSAACPLAGVIEEQVQKVMLAFGRNWRLIWVWMPPWGPDRISNEGRNQMRNFKTMAPDARMHAAESR